MPKTYDDPKKLIIGPGRAVYAYVFRPRNNDIDQDNPRLEYSITLLIPKESHKHLAYPDAEIDAIKAAIRAAWVEKFGSQPPKGWKNPLKDGDRKADDDSEPLHPGYFYIRAKTSATWKGGEPKDPPLVIDGNREKVTGGYQSGDWCKVKVKFGAYDSKANKGVSCYLEAVQWLYKDEPLGGSANVTSEDEFDTVPDAHVVGASSAGDEADPFADDAPPDVADQHAINVVVMDFVANMPAHGFKLTGSGENKRAAAIAKARQLLGAPEGATLTHAEWKKALTKLKAIVPSDYTFDDE